MGKNIDLDSEIQQLEESIKVLEFSNETEWIKDLRNMVLTAHTLAEQTVEDVLSLRIFTWTVKKIDGTSLTIFNGKIRPVFENLSFVFKLNLLKTLYPHLQLNHYSKKLSQLNTLRNDFSHRKIFQLKTYKEKQKKLDSLIIVFEALKVLTPMMEDAIKDVQGLIKQSKES